jgi:phosphoribosyl 1,2-cyclic phosphate phosphodiesterase
MRVTLLGTGGSAGVPLIGGPDGAGDWGRCDPAEPRNRRTRASILIAGPEGTLLVDTAPDLRAQLLACRVARVDAILFTHAHADHVAGLDDTRILNRLAGRPLPAFATEPVLAEITNRFPYAFRPWKPPGFFRPVLEPQPLAPRGRARLVGLDMELFAQDHGYGVSLGLRAGGFAYSTDVVRLDAEAFTVLAGVDTWVVDCFGLSPHPTHAHLERVLEWVGRVAARRTVLTHMGPEMDWARVGAMLPAGVEMGWDGMVLG